MKGFSLIELLISLIIISLITAAFSPIVTKKIKNRDVIISGGDNGLSAYCEQFSSECALCYKERCVVCEKKLSDKPV